MTTMYCPKNSAHKTFVTGAVVCQLWVVDEHGNFIECIDDCTDVYAYPRTENVWECVECGTQAEEFKIHVVKPLEQEQ